MRRLTWRRAFFGIASAAVTACVADNLYWRRRGGAFNHR